MILNIVAAIALTAASITIASAQTIDKFSADFAANLETGCIAIQRADAQNKNISTAILTRYCNCVATHAIEVVTLDELFALQKTGQRPQSMQNKLNALGTTCLEVIMGKTRDGPINKN